MNNLTNDRMTKLRVMYDFSGLTITAGKADFRMAIVLDDVHKSFFKKLNVKEPESKKKIFTFNSSEITPK